MDIRQVKAMMMAVLVLIRLLRMVLDAEGGEDASATKRHAIARSYLISTTSAWHGGLG